MGVKDLHRGCRRPFWRLGSECSGLRDMESFRVLEEGDCGVALQRFFWHQGAGVGKAIGRSVSQHRQEGTVSPETEVAVQWRKSALQETWPCTNF